MNSTNRLRARAGKSAALAVALAVASVCPLPAQTIGAANDFWFAGTRLPFEHPQLHEGAFAVATDDDGLARFLAKVGAVLSYQPGQKFVIVTDSQRRTIAFALGDSRFTVGNVVQSGAFAPYAVGDVAYVPLLDLARALYVDPVDDAGTVVLQPQIGALVVRTSNGVTSVTLEGAAPLRFKRTSKPDDDTVSLVFSGTASTLESDRVVDASALRDVSISVAGTAKNPTTVVTFAGVAGAAHVLVPSGSPNALTLAFAPSAAQVSGVAIPESGGSAVAVAPALLATDPRSNAPASLAQPAPAQHAAFSAPTLPPYGDTTEASEPPGTAAPAPMGTPSPTADSLSPATITAVDPQSTGDGFAIRLAISGPVTYEWHRLSDNRWYVDFKPATLAVPAEDVPLGDPSILALRVKPFVGPNDHLATVRVAFTMPSPRGVSLVPSSDGMTIAIASEDDTGLQTAGTGELVDGRVVASIVPLPAVVAPPETDATQPWKFAPPIGSRNPKLIVIDPGHGGSDRGAAHNGLTEADLNLDVSRRLRAVLVSRGWQVKMTRDSDVDVYQPNDSARDELQARDDIANNAGARLLVSVHTNSFTTSELNGTTTYYYTATSRALAEAVHARLAAALPTNDDGIRKENFYVIHHQNMPGILVEMAFLSNPSDAKLLYSGTFLESVATAIADGIGDYATGTTSTTDGN